MEAKKNLDDIRHSCAHLLAAAVLDLFPKTKHTIGPRIEKRMGELLKDWDSFSSREVTLQEAKTIYKENIYKCELINEIIEKGEKIMLYKNGNFEDLCRGGHSENPKKDIGAFKLLSLAGAYWRGG